MYNMEVSFGSYKIRLEMLVLMVVLVWIIFGSLLCGCCRVSIFEGLANYNKAVVKKTSVTNSNSTNKSSTSSSTTTPKVPMEGFANRTTTGPVFADAKGPDYIMNPSTWSAQALTYSSGSTPSEGVKSIWDRPKQPIPLPENELDMFATTGFKPECCPNAYSNSTGCACMTTDQYNYLKSRGGNNVPYSEY
jgi:hypothetical protein